MELKKRGWHCRYVQEYLAIGEAPDQVRNCFQQRSRWTKGHFQIIFNPLRNPLFQRGLPLFDRLMYCSGTWCYFVGAVSTPLLAVVPLITIWVRMMFFLPLSFFPLFFFEVCLLLLVFHSLSPLCFFLFLSFLFLFFAAPFSSLSQQHNKQVGFFPLVVTRELALALTLYAAATQALLYHVRTPRHLEPLWFANVANQILWW